MSEKISIGSNPHSKFPWILEVGDDNFCFADELDRDDAERASQLAYSLGRADGIADERERWEKKGSGGDPHPQSITAAVTIEGAFKCPLPDVLRINHAMYRRVEPEAVPDIVNHPALRAVSAKDAKPTDPMHDVAMSIAFAAARKVDAEIKMTKPAPPAQGVFMCEGARKLFAELLAERVEMGRAKEHFKATVPPTPAWKPPTKDETAEFWDEWRDLPIKQRFGKAWVDRFNPRGTCHPVSGEKNDALALQLALERSR